MFLSRLWLERSASPHVYVVVIILFPSLISSDSGASDCAVPVVIYFGEPCGKSRIGVGKQDLMRFREPLGEQELYTSLRAYSCHPLGVFLHPSASCVVASAMLLDYVVYVVVKNNPPPLTFRLRQSRHNFLQFCSN